MAKRQERQGWSSQDADGRLSRVVVARGDQASSAVGRNVKKVIKQPKQQPRRSVLVFASLIGVLTLTSVLLRVMQGAPLRPDIALNAQQSETRQGLLAIFNTRTPAKQGRWASVFVHHSRTTGGTAASLNNGQGAGDHFVIGNGHTPGILDGEIQFTDAWDRQVPADPVPGQAHVEQSCISICVIGDFDRTAPTAMQLRQLERLVQTLQERLRIPASQVWLVDYAESAVAVGKYFPTSAFQSQLLR